MASISTRAEAVDNRNNPRQAKGPKGIRHTPTERIKGFLHETPFEHPFIVGYYGGGNYGDELLLETLLAQFAQRGIDRVEVPYQRPHLYSTYHAHQCMIVDARKPLAVLRSMLRSKEIIVGGGGLWNKEYSPRMTALCALLLGLRLIGKRVSIIGVGFYDTAGVQARVSAWMAAKASERIIVRDEESHANFARYAPHVGLDKDIAYLWRGQTPDAGERPLGKLSNKTLVIVYRRFTGEPAWQRKYEGLISRLVSEHRRPTRLVLFEPEEVDSHGMRFFESLARKHKHCRVVPFEYNPVSLLSQLREDKDRVVVIAPQFHAKVVAHIAGAPFFPLAYDRKCLELLKQMGVAGHSIDDVEYEDLRAFVDHAMGKQAGVTAIERMGGTHRA